jgi:hypothetical protein
VTGNFEKYDPEDLMEKTTDIMESWDFEDKFVNKVLAKFPKMKQIK